MVAGGPVCVHAGQEGVFSLSLLSHPPTFWDEGEAHTPPSGRCLASGCAPHWPHSQAPEGTGGAPQAQRPLNPAMGRAAHLLRLDAASRACVPQVCCFVSFYFIFKGFYFKKT